MPRWPGYKRLVEIGAGLSLHPKPSWWHPFQRIEWRRDCAHIGIVVLYRQSIDLEEE